MNLSVFSNVKNFWKIPGYELRSEAEQKEEPMKEKKVIDYTRTYRRIEADKKKCILYIVILILLGFLLM